MNENLLFAICVNNDGYPASLELHKIYRVMPDEDALQDNELRIIDESGEDYLYATDRFILTTFSPKITHALTMSFA